MLEKCYEVSELNLPCDISFSGTYQIIFAFTPTGVKFMFDELMNNPNYNRTMLIDSETHPSVSNVCNLCQGSIMDTIISNTDDCTERVRIVMAPDDTKKVYLIATFRSKQAYDDYTPDFQYGELSSDTPVDYNDNIVNFGLNHLHGSFES